MGFMFCDLHVSLKIPLVRGYKFVEFALFQLQVFRFLKNESIHGNMA